MTELNALSSVLTRTRKVDIPDRKAVREPRQIDVEWTEAERNCYRVVRAWARRQALASGGPPGFATQMPLRQAASCLPVMRDRLLARDPGLFVSDPELNDFDDDLWPDGATPSQPIGEMDDPFRALGSTDCSTTPISAPPRATASAWPRPSPARGCRPWPHDPFRSGGRGRAELVATTARFSWPPPFRFCWPLTTDTKFDRFVAHLDMARRLGTGQVLVFSFFRGTLAYLERRLKALGWRVKSMHGGVAVPDRQRLIDEFRNGGFDILLSSEVGSEGLDFQFCNVIVNYDLPWNPMKVEQRIGRLDRFGQMNDKIFIFNFHVPGPMAHSWEPDAIGRIGACLRNRAPIDTTRSFRVYAATWEGWYDGTKRAERPQWSKLALGLLGDLPADESVRVQAPPAD